MVLSERTARVLLGRITGAHGIRGDIVVHAFTAQPGDIAAYGPLEDSLATRRLTLKVLRVTEKGVIARVEGVADRTTAEALKGTELWVARDRLPETDAGEFYHADLIGLVAEAPDGTLIGRITTVQNYGAGDLLEIRLEGSRRTELVPFTDAFVPQVNVAGGKAVVIMPTAGDDDGPSEAD
ncbi:MAG: ribosome maturation factor RimM [Hyphomicrobiaceae bacterium]|nr:ribosome maturation factor RimM [Hyphomicrobiaceae bacterium]